MSNGLKLPEIIGKEQTTCAQDYSTAVFQWVCVDHKGPWIVLLVFLMVSNTLAVLIQLIRQTPKIELKIDEIFSNLWRSKVPTNSVQL